MRYVTAVNRTDRPLKCTWGGIHYSFAPGKHTLPIQTALAFRYQNPIKGSDDPETGEFQYYVGIENEPGCEDCTPVAWSKDIELHNRKNLANPLPVVVMNSNGLYAPARDVALSKPVGDAGGFTGTK